jgi:hypothetical protein
MKHSNKKAVCGKQNLSEEMNANLRNKINQLHNQK